MSAPDFKPAAVDAIFADLKRTDTPGVTVGIACGGRPVYRQGFGLAHAELPAVLEPSTRMRIGSTTKQFTALGIMLLHEDGALGLDDAAGTHLPELNAINGAATIRQLLTNTSGLADAFSYKLEFAGTHTRPIDGTELLGLYGTITHRNGPAGQSWRYSNGGWLILGAIIERLSRSTLEDFLTTRIFRPLGMTNTMVRRWDRDFVSNSATAHVRTSGGFIKADYGMDNFAGAGAIVSTVDDMFRWLAHMDAPTVGTAETWRQILTPVVLPNGTSTDYGFGIFRNLYRGIETIHHAGGGCGCNAQALKVPSAGLDIVVMSNRDDVSSSALVRKVLDTLLSFPEAHDQTSAIDTAGVFRSQRTGRVLDVRDLAPEKSYLQRHVRTESPSRLTLTDFGYADELDLVHGPAPAIVGRYRHGDIEATISANSEMTTCTPMGGARFTLEHLAGPVFRARLVERREEYGGLLDFTVGGGFAYSTAFLDQLPFAKCDESRAV